MNILIVFSLFIKAFGAGLEILTNSLISQQWGVESLGEYAFFVSIAEGYYMIFYSGIIKFNNFYIPRNIQTNSFKKEYYLKYVLPICLVAVIIIILIKKYYLILAILSGFVFLCVMDVSSSLMSNGRYKTSLVGEYCIGRIFLISGITILLFLGVKNILAIYLVYILQFFFLFTYYQISIARRPYPNIEKTQKGGMCKEYIIFQTTEIAHTIVIQSSIIIQYIFGGAYQTAIVSVVLTVRRIVNFITGPTSKIYQPEFSRLYKLDNKNTLADLYSQITRFQLCLILPVFTLLITRPDLLLRIFNSELITYKPLIRYTSIVFLFMVAFGPLSNVLPMIGKELIDNALNWLSVGVMFLTLFLTKDNEFFVIISFCAQILFVTLVKAFVYISFFKRLPLPFFDCIKFLMICSGSILVITITPDFIICSLLVCAVQFIINCVYVLPRDELYGLLQRISCFFRKNNSNNDSMDI